jgi:hypothetical protein
MFDHAQRAAALGYRLLPCRPNDKRAVLVGWPTAATDDAEQVREWFGGDWPANLAVACGPQPNGVNLVVIDIDAHHGGMEAWKSLGIKVPSSWVVHKTPNGGRHLFFDAGDLVLSNSRGSLPAGIDVRGAGGYVVLPPSTIDDRAYTRAVELGCVFTAVPPRLPEALVAYLRPPEEIERSISNHPSNLHRAEVGETPADYVRRCCDWSDRLLRHGWTSAGGDRWVRPDKNARDGHSAVLHEPDGPLVAWTSTIPPQLESWGVSNRDGSLSFSLFDFIAAYEFGGDRAAASSWVRRELMPRDEVVVRVAPPEEGSPEVAPPNSWLGFVDVGAVLRGERLGREATILRRADGVGLLYPGIVNMIYGDSGLGKGWVCCAAAAEQIKLGHDVVYVDLEDSPGSIVNRLLILGVERGDLVKHLLYVKPQDPAMAGKRADPVIAQVAALVDQRDVTLMIIDSVGEAFALDGISENNDDEVGPWMAHIAKRFTRPDRAVLIVDHSTKSQENRLHPSGSKRKRASAETVYLIEPVRAMAKGKGGAVKLVVAKDRHGQGQGTTAAIFTFIPSGDDMRVVIAPVTDTAGPSATETRHAEVSELMLRCLGEARRMERDEKTTAWSINTLSSFVGGKAATTKEAIRRLVARGYFVEAGTAKGNPLHCVSDGAPSTRYDP